MATLKPYEKLNSQLPTQLSSRLNKIRDIATAMPGAKRAQAAMESVESFALNELKARLDKLEPRTKVPTDDRRTTLTKRLHPSVLLRELLEGALEQDKDAALESLYTSILLELTPDEAVLLATLSDGEDFPLVNICASSRMGQQKVIAGNFCAIDRAAPVKLRDYVPAYIDHLMNLGLAEIGPEDRALDVNYQIVEGHPKVLEIIKEMSPRYRGVKTQRRTLHISALGRDLWQYCDPNTFGIEDDESTE